MISVIIPTFHRLDSVRRCLESLQAQDPDVDMEIILVDNAVDEDLARFIDAFNQEAKIPAGYLPEPRLGVHNARHAGARAAGGELLVFTDDDTTFDPRWLESYATAFAENPEMAAAGGPVRPAWASPPPAWLLEFIGESKSFPLLALMEPHEDFVLEANGFFFSNNMAIRRDVFFEMGGFNPEAYGADIWLGDGETGLNHKMWAAGLLIGYVPGALIYHHIPASRMTLDYCRHWSRNWGACDAYARYHSKVPGRPRLFGDLIRNSALVSAMAAWIHVRHRGKLDPVSLRRQMRLAYAGEQSAYMLRLLRHREFRRMVAHEDWLNRPYVTSEANEAAS